MKIRFESTTRVMKKTVFTVLAASMLMLGSPTEHHSSAAAASFKDVPSSHWAKTAIDQAVSKGYFKGYADGTFKPSASVTRAEFAVLLDRVSTNQADGTSASFSDVTGNWSESGVKSASAKGFITTADYPNGFKPSTPITRKEMAKWMSSGLAAESDDYKQALSDTADTVVPVAEYFKKTMSKSDLPYVSVVIGTGLMGGYADGTFGPVKTTTRAEAAVILMRLADVQSKKADSFSDLNELREVGTTGTNLKSITNLSTGITKFENVQFKKMNFKNGAGKSTLNYFLVVDTRDWKNRKSIYNSTFVVEDERRPDEKDYYRVYIQQTLYPEKKGFSRDDYMNSSTDHWAVGVAIRNELPKKYGYQTLPTGDPIEPFQKYVSNQIGMEIWTRNYIEADNSLATYRTDDGSIFSITM
ncbi:S-layer homology domain-containing protein [Paenibacillus sp. WLX2291]|uniref:S-layer homology domain-containing protein n=1 Tax=Paenibacillus sp. WLX2291 TaxID=3296934 RepID=UPI00398433AB